jgi:hypothetical protein
MLIETKKLVDEPKIYLNDLYTKNVSVSPSIFHLFIDLSSRYYDITYGSEDSDKLLIISSEDRDEWELRFKNGQELFFFENREKNQLHLLVINGMYSFEKISSNMIKVL